MQKLPRRGKREEKSAGVRGGGRVDVREERAKRARVGFQEGVKKKSAGTAEAEIVPVNFASVHAINVHHTGSVSVHRLLASSFSRLLARTLPTTPQPLPSP